MKLIRILSLVFLILQAAGPALAQCGPIIRIPITSLSKAQGQDYMILTDSCGNQYYILKDSVATKGGITNQYFIGDSLITVINGGDTLVTVIHMQGDTSGTGRFRWVDNISDQDTTYTFPAGIPTDNVLVTNGLQIDAGSPVKLKWGGRLIENTDIYGDNNAWNVKFDSINLYRIYGNSTRIYPNQSFLVQSNNSPTMYVQIQTPTSMYLRADTVMHLDLYNHSATDTSHLLIRTDRARDGSWVKGGFLQLLRTTSGTYQGDSDWSLYAFPLAAPDSAGHYVLNYSTGSRTFSWAEESGGGGSTCYAIDSIVGADTTFYRLTSPGCDTIWMMDIRGGGSSICYSIDSIVGTDTTYYRLTAPGCDTFWIMDVRGGLQGSGTLNYLAKWTPDGETLGNSRIIDNGTNIGINNPVPSVSALVDAIGLGNTSSTYNYIWNSSSSTIGWFRDDGVFYGSRGTFGSTSIPAGVELYVGGNARISGSDGVPTLIMGRDGDGDIADITIGSGLSLSSGTLTASTALDYWEENLIAYDGSVQWKPASGTNVPALITPKGTGAFIVGQQPDGGSTGGNTRGAYAIDIQTERSAANQVAGSANSICIGNQNRGGGQQAICIGQLNESTVSNAVTIGENNDATGANSFASGGYATAYLQGMRARQGNQSIGQGLAQTIEFRLLKGITGTAETELVLNGTGGQAILASSNRVWNVRIQLIATTRSVGNGTGSSGASFLGTYDVGIKRIGSSTSLFGAGVVTSVTSYDADMSDSVVSITADDSTEALKITFTPPSTAGSTTLTNVVATIFGTETGF